MPLLVWLGYVSNPNGGRVISLLNPFDQGFSTSQFGFSGFNVGAELLSTVNQFFNTRILIQFTAWLRQRKNLFLILAWTCLPS